MQTFELLGFFDVALEDDGISAGAPALEGFGAIIGLLDAGDGDGGGEMGEGFALEASVTRLTC